MNRKSVLAILGSPHRNGTTAAMMDRSEERRVGKECG